MPDSKAHFIQYLKDNSLKWSKQREQLFDLLFPLMDMLPLTSYISWR